MMSDPIYEGDVVQLNSGGPEMTVAKIEGGKAWLTAEGHGENSEPFALDELTFVRRYSVGRTTLAGGDPIDKEA